MCVRMAHCSVEISTQFSLASKLADDHIVYYSVTKTENWTIMNAREMTYWIISQQNEMYKHCFGFAFVLPEP